MLKLLSGAWYAAEVENRTLRDELRAAFWSDIGVKPATRTSDVDLAPQIRSQTLARLVQQTISGKEKDTHLADISAQVGAVLAEWSLGSSLVTGKPIAVSHDEQSPSAMRAFFVTPDMTTFELTRRS